MSDGEFNPYEVIHDETESGSSDLTEDMAVEGKTLWILPNRTLPPRCIFTNATGEMLSLIHI